MKSGSSSDEAFCLRIQYLNFDSLIPCPRAKALWLCPLSCNLAIISCIKPAFSFFVIAFFCKDQLHAYFRKDAVCRTLTFILSPHIVEYIGDVVVVFHTFQHFIHIGLLFRGKRFGVVGDALKGKGFDLEMVFLQIFLNRAE